jgi:LysR family transcriptional regulator, flagellar master operon regulator
MDIATFRTFIAAAATGSFSGAAQRVNASPSAVTERIKQLEYRVGTRLFNRSKKGCSLTPAGRRFLEPATQILRSWDLGQYEAALPENIEGSFSFGCQYALWSAVVKPWFTETHHQNPNISFRVTTASPLRLNRDLADGQIEMAILYDPVHRGDTESEILFPDELVLVTATPDIPWQENYVRFRWGQGIGTKIASKLGATPGSGLMLDLGRLSVPWLIEERACGFIPARLCQDRIKQGKLTVVPDSPKFDFPAHICWRRDINSDIAKPLIDSARSFVNLS